VILRLTASGLASAVAATVVLLPAAPAAAKPMPAPDPDGPALTLLERADHAPRTTAYSGLQFVATWSRAGSSSYLVDIQHQPGFGTAIQVQGTSVASPGASFTPDDQQDRPSIGVLSGGDVGELAVLSQNYDLRVAGSASVAGRPATVIEVYRPRDRVAARFWVDDRTGLLLRREVYDGRGRTIRASAFIDLKPGAPAALAHVPPSMPQPAGRPVAPAELVGLVDDGWSCPWHLGAGLALYDARRDNSPQGAVLHLSYSDGLSAVSVFEQRGRLDTAGLAGFRAAKVGGVRVHVDDGYPQRVVWAAKGKVFTVIADAPAETVTAVVRSLPHAEKRPGVAQRVGHRVGRGISRVASWFNPFG
jgi:sigma-E factor negative regulatory protein RseB